MNHTIRSVRPDDARALSEIYRYYVENTAVTFEYEAPTVSEFLSRINAYTKHYPYLCIEAEGELLGFAFAHAFRERPAYDYSAEVSIYLRSDCRRTGLGREIYTALENELKRMGVRILYACVAVPEDNDPHLPPDSPLFHEALGYRKCGEFRRCGYKLGRWYTMIWMEKMIGDFPDIPSPLIPYPDLS